MELNLKGKHVVVTGGANGLCHDIAAAYYEAGAMSTRQTSAPAS